MLVGTDVCVWMVFVWEKTWGNPPVWLGDRMTISHPDAGYRTWVAAVSGECANTALASQPITTRTCLTFLIKLVQSTIALGAITFT